MNKTRLSRRSWRVLFLAAALFCLSAYAAVHSLAGAWHVDPVPEPPPAPCSLGDLPPKEPVLPPSSETMHWSPGMSRPVPLSTPPPHFTEVARRARVEGVVIIEAVIDEKGRVGNMRILKGLPLGLDQQAVEAVRTWRFKPATRDHKPVTISYTLMVNFRLKG